MKLSELKIGVDVRVTSMSDQECDPNLLGSVGHVSRIQTSGAGVGESNEDPYISVTFKDKTDGFWIEELTLIK